MDWQRWMEVPELADFVALERGGWRVLARRGHEAAVGLLGLDGPARSGAEVVTGGRAAHPVVTLPDGERVVVRHYRRGGAMRHLNRDRYFLGHRAFQELRATERARAAGVRVPVVVAAAERPGWLGYRAVLATRWIAGAGELIRWLRDRRPEEALAALRAAGGEVARLHDGGVGHPDLNLRNLLVAPAGPAAPDLYLLDLDRARLYPGATPPPRRARDLLRLARSARKLRAPIEAAGWRAFREGYGPGWPLAAADLG